MISHVSVKLPSSVVAVIVAVPIVSAVTTPSSSTVATAVSEELQVTFLFVASAGATVAVSVTCEGYEDYTATEDITAETTTLSITLTAE